VEHYNSFVLTKENLGTVVKEIDKMNEHIDVAESIFGMVDRLLLFAFLLVVGVVAALVAIFGLVVWLV
jgi:hypothetical protein